MRVSKSYESYLTVANVAPLRCCIYKIAHYWKVLIVCEAHNQNIKKTFELITEDSFKRWFLHSGLLTYLNKYLVNHISEKILKEKIMKIENRKSYALNHEKDLKDTQEKVTAISTK